MRLLSLVALTLICGCAAPHRTAKSTHVSRQFSGRSDGMISEDVYTDKESGGGCFFLTDPSVQSVSVIHRNQKEIGGGSAFKMGSGTVTVDPQATSIIEAGGAAAGKVIGAALKEAVK